MSKSGKIRPVLLVVLGVTIGLFGFFLLLANPFGWKMPTPFLKSVPTKSITSKQGDLNIPMGLVRAPTPTLILPKGKQTYYVRSGSGSATKINQIDLDPLDVNKGEKQTINVKAQSDEKITSITITLKTDKQAAEIPMKLLNGPATDGEWIASYVLQDTANTTYFMTFNSVTASGKMAKLDFPIR